MIVKLVKLLVMFCLFNYGFYFEEAVFATGGIFESLFVGEGGVYFVSTSYVLQAGDLRCRLYAGGVDFAKHFDIL